MMIRGNLPNVFLSYVRASAVSCSGFVFSFLLLLGICKTLKSKILKFDFAMVVCTTLGRWLGQSPSRIDSILIILHLFTTALVLPLLLGAFVAPQHTNKASSKIF